MTSEVHQAPSSLPNATSIEALESAIQHLVTSWQRRQRCHHLLLLPFTCFLKPQENDDNKNHNAITKRASYRTRLADLINSLPVHLAPMILILLDLTLTVLDISSTLLSCGNSSSSSSSKQDQNNLYHWAEIVILSLLSAKVLALALALGCSFFKSPGHVIDGIVMVGTLVLEVVAEGKGAGLLVVVSLWRVIRVVESAFEHSNEAIRGQIEGIVMQFEVLRAENQMLQGTAVDKDERIKKLEEELASMKTEASVD